MKSNFFSLMFAVISVLAVTNYGWAAPSVNSADGTFSQGQSINISGSGFGTKPTAAPVLWDTVDNIPSYSGLSDGNSIPVGGSNPWPSPYGNSSGKNYVKYNTNDGQRGVSSAQYKATNQTTAYLDGLTWPATGYTYVSWWWKTDTNVGGGDHSSKFLRMSDASDEVNRTFSWTQRQDYVYDTSSSCDFVNQYGVDFQNYCSDFSYTYSQPVNTWVFFEAWFNSKNQTYTLRMNGSKIRTTSYSPGTTSFNELWKIGFDGGGNSPPSITWWMDDIYVDNSFSRVMLGNAPTYDSSTHFEMQPLSSWSEGSITAKFNQGSFANGATAYIYIIDASGAVNSNGYPITIGGGSGPAPTPTRFRPRFLSTIRHRSGSSLPTRLVPPLPTGK